MIRLTVEEENLLSIYDTGSKRELFERVNAALPFMDGDMQELAVRALQKRSLRGLPFLPQTTNERAETADAAAKPESQRPCEKILL